MITNVAHVAKVLHGVGYIGAYHHIPFRKRIYYYYYWFHLTRRRRRWVDQIKQLSADRRQSLRCKLRHRGEISRDRNPRFHQRRHHYISSTFLLHPFLPKEKGHSLFLSTILRTTPFSRTNNHL